MKLHTLAAAAVLSFAVCAPAFAGEISVTLQNPVSAKTKVVAGGSVFQCADSACVSLAATDRALTAAACKQLVKEVGPVSAYGNDRKQLEADALTRCNAAAQTAAN